MTDLRAKMKALDRFAAFEKFVEERKQLLERTARRSETNGITVCGNVVVLDAWRRSGPDQARAKGL